MEEERMKAGSLGFYVCHALMVQGGKQNAKAPAHLLFAGDCSTSRKACKNCSCGRAEKEAAGERVKLTQEMLDNPQSSCGSVATLVERQGFVCFGPAGFQPSWNRCLRCLLMPVALKSLKSHQADPEREATKRELHAFVHPWPVRLTRTISAQGVEVELVAVSPEAYKDQAVFQNGALVGPNKGLTKLQSIIQGTPAAPLPAVDSAAVSSLNQQDCASMEGQGKTPRGLQIYVSRPQGLAHPFLRQSGYSCSLAYLSTPAPFQEMKSALKFVRQSEQEGKDPVTFQWQV
eukprot:1142193-Pelagomonas_calceolata.AAC.6